MGRTYVKPSGTDACTGPTKWTCTRWNGCVGMSVFSRGAFPFVPCFTRWQTSQPVIYFATCAFTPGHHANLFVRSHVPSRPMCRPKGASWTVWKNLRRRLRGSTTTRFWVFLSGLFAGQPLKLRCRKIPWINRSLAYHKAFASRFWRSFHSHRCPEACRYFSTAGQDLFASWISFCSRMGRSLLALSDSARSSVDAVIHRDE